MTHQATLVHREYIHPTTGRVRAKVWGACTCGWTGLPYEPHRPHLAERDIQKHLDRQHGKEEA